MIAKKSGGDTRPIMEVVTRDKDFVRGMGHVS